MSYTDVWFLTMWRSVLALAITATVIWEVSSTGEECSFNSSPEDDSSYSDSDSQSCENDYPPKCKNPNEVYDPCDAPCPARRCDFNAAVVRCAAPPKVGDSSCVVGCRCIDGYLRDKHGVCIPSKQCPKCKNPNEVYDPCDAPCPARRCDFNAAVVRCAAPPKVGDSSCVVGCRCIDGYLRDKHGVCIPSKQCPTLCKQYELFSDCANGLCRVQDCKDKGLTRPCPPMVPGSCISGCVCQVGTLRKNGTCVPEAQCVDIPSCKKNEEYSDCSNGLCRVQECKDKGLSRPCPPMAPGSCLPGCVCPEKYLRLNGTCVPEEQCEPTPVCRSDEELSTCSNAICRHQDCKDKGQPVACPQVTQCIKGCVCPEGTLRAANGICVNENQCPTTPTQCKQHELFSDCANGLCRVQDCKDKGLTRPCPPMVPGSCIPGCVCQVGSLRKNGTCVPEAQCVDIPPCKQNEQYSDCSNGLCRVQECKDKGLTRPCPPMAPGSCRPGCVCPEKYLRLNGTCVPEDQCAPPTCKENEIYSNCSNGLCKFQNCTQYGQPIPFCPRFDSNNCKGGCICQDGYLRNPAGICVPQKECPAYLCTKANHEFYSTCTNGEGVPRTCSQKELPCPDIDVANCERGCVCEDNYLRDARGTCIPSEQCPIVCKENQVYSNCTNGGCAAKKCSQMGYRIPCVDYNSNSCVAGCACVDDYLMADNGTCIPRDQCPSCGGDPNAGPGCGNCGRSCSDYMNPRPICPLRPCYINDCQCKPDYVFDYNLNKCVLPKDCTAACKENEIYLNCSNGLCKFQNCTQYGQPIPFCPRFDLNNCRGGCICQDGYLRNPAGICIPQNECPASLCPKANHEVYSNCTNGGGVPRTCSQKGLPCPDVDVANCERGCICEDNYLRDDNGDCIPSEQCLQCTKLNEVYDPCPDCSPQTCKTKNDKYHCPMIPANKTGPNCKPACRCNPGYFRNLIGECILASECDKCPAKHEFFSCGSACDNVCATLGKPCPIINIKCNERCYCEDGYARATNNTCIPVKDCKDDCKVNEVYSSCPDASCAPLTCAQAGFPIQCASYTQCPGEPGCICRSGYLRNDSGICIPSKQCPSCGGDENAYSGCGSNCGKKCSEIGKNITICPLFCNINGCNCKDNYYYDGNRQKCVPACDCTPTCKVNEEFSNCANGICIPQECKDKGQTFLCKPMHPGSCVPGCICKSKYLRRNGTCIPKDECEPTPVCRSDEELSTCANGLDRRQKCTEKDKPFVCPSVTQCKKGCVCPKGTLRDANNICIKEDQCPHICPDGEVYSNCPPTKCDGEYCPKNRNSVQSCPTPKTCGKGRCVCAFNSHRDRQTGKCIRTSDCPPFACSRGHEEYNSCPSRCPDSNCADYLKNVTCPNPRFKELFVVACKPACRCQKGYYRNKNQKCVTAKQCQPPTPPNNCGKDEKLQLVLAQACNTLAVNSLLELDVGAPGVSKVLSAISYFIPMALLALYSKGQTYTELMNALNVTTKDDIRSSFPVLIKSIRALQGKGLSIAYKIYVNDPYKLSASFKNDSVAIIDAAAENFNFNNPCQAANTINKWVSDSTKGNVKNLVCEDMFNCMTRMVLVNAMYFKGVWQKEFNPKLTKSSNFYVNCHKTTKVKMMQQQGKFSYTYSPDVDAQFVDIPFQNNSMSFVLVLPSKRDGLTNVLEKFRDPPLLNKVLSGLHPENITIFMPKFDISTKFDIEDVLKPTGVKTIFGPEAEFSGIVVPDEALYVSKAVQKAIITVNEKGAEASATTVAAVVGTTALPRPPQPKIIVRADHPFIYGIRVNSIFALGGSFYG